ncbi:hypothetical protein Vwe01_16690 [Micromonospora andamanensis]|nr:hypothetical protein Vwe01_16690 [Micromonospora andamanensis]
MAGPVTSIDQVPLPDVLPSEYAAALDELQRLGRTLDVHRAAATRIGWWWYPEHRQRPPVPADGVHLLLFDTTITLFNSGQDWLELTLDVAWGSRLTVNAAVEVGCWCSQDHNMHQVRSENWPVTGSHDLVRGFAAGIAMLTIVLDSGSFDPSAWRVEAGLADAPPRRQ